MRTTVDLPDDLHRIATSIAHDRRQSLSRTVADLLRLALAGGRTSSGLGHRDGFPTLSTAGPITAEDVRSVEDD